MNRRRSEAERRLLGIQPRQIALSWLIGAAFLASPAQAERPLSPEEELIEASLDYEKARSGTTGDLKAYISLREIWSAWKDVDPLKVEQALLLAAEDKTKSAPVRDYATKLSAYARLRRGDLEATHQSFDQRNYITDWQIVGPFDNEGKAGFEQVFGPDATPEEPLVPGRAFSGKERPVRYRALPDIFQYGWVDFGYVFRPSTHICGHATTFISGTRKEDEKKSRKITLWVGSDGAHRVQFNGQVAVEEKAYRGFDTSRYAATVLLRPGQNRLSIKACGADTSPMFAIRVGDEKGNVGADIAVSSAIQASEQARENVLLGQKEDLPRQDKRLRGPLSLVDEISANKNASAEELELAARYLVITDGDDNTVHQARNLAQRAVEKQASVKRYLLLASLAEDRNAAAAALDSAAKLSKGDDIDLLLAQAWHKKTGPNPQESFPLYDQVLSLDPDNMTALQGRVELYNRAGLKRTALSLLERAYVRRPHSVLLANMVASQRGALGLSTPASEAEDRYSAVRFDDSSFLTERMELALARKNKKAVRHWLSRVESSDAHSLWTYTMSARVHRALGERKRALLMLEKAHEIAPEDVAVLKSLADLKGRMGQRDEQLALLREVLKLRPQEVDVRKYVDHIEPPEAPADEKYAMAAEEFLKKRHAPADGHPRRTLQELTVSTVYENGLSSQFRQVVFQPLTDSSAATSRQYAFQYQADTQRVQLKGARVYRADGSTDEAIESGEGAANDPSVSMYTSARTFYVQFPRLEPGDVVELRYRIDDITPRNEFADYYGDVVYLQSDEPVGHAEYVLITPKKRKLNVDAQLAGLKETVKETKTERIYEFEAEDIPAIMPEANMPPWSEVLGFVHVSTYSSWDELGKWYWGLVQEQLDIDAETRKKLLEITKDAKTDEEKVKAVYAWVTKNTRYVALEFGIYGFKPRRCVQTVNRGWGDCKDKATVIVTFLRELGIDANLVIIRTGMRGDFHSKLPSLAPFDHAIAYVPSMDLYLDGTAEHTGIYELPVMDQGSRALLVLDGKAKPVRLPAGDPKKNIISRDLQARLKKDGSASVELSYSVVGQSAPGFRARYGSESNLKDRLSSDLGNEFPGLELNKNSIKTSDLSDGEAPVDIDIKATAPRFARAEGDSLSMAVTLKNRLTPRFAALSARKQDVRIQGFSTIKETVNLTLPAGAQVLAAPPESQVDTRFGTYGVTYKKEGPNVVVESHLSLKVARVTPKDYPAFRKFCVEADQALAHRLVVTP